VICSEELAGVGIAYVFVTVPLRLMRAILLAANPAMIPSGWLFEIGSGYSARSR
jgi:hypothetical protein